MIACLPGLAGFSFGNHSGVGLIRQSKMSKRICISDSRQSEFYSFAFSLFEFSLNNSNMWMAFSNFKFELVYWDFLVLECSSPSRFWYVIGWIRVS